MGTSNWQNISYCIDLIRKINPDKILDVGVGFGRWGILCREFLDVWNGRIYESEWLTKIYGIEIFEKNISKYHYYFYNQIFNMDAHKFIKDTSENYDLIILGDVLEHFEKNIAIEVLNESIRKSKFVLLNIPLGKYWKQDELYDNKYEKHLSFWEKKDFKKLNPIAEKKFRDELFRKFGVFLFSKDRNRFFSNNYRVKIGSLLTQYPKTKKHLKKILNENSLFGAI